MANIYCGLSFIVSDLGNENYVQHTPGTHLFSVDGQVANVYLALRAWKQQQQQIDIELHLKNIMRFSFVCRWSKSKPVFEINRNYQNGAARGRSDQRMIFLQAIFLRNFLFFSSL